MTISQPHYKVYIVGEHSMVTDQDASEVRRPSLPSKSYLTWHWALLSWSLKWSKEFTLGELFRKLNEILHFLSTCPERKHPTDTSIVSNITATTMHNMRSSQNLYFSRFQWLSFTSQRLALATDYGNGPRNFVQLPSVQILGDALVVCLCQPYNIPSAMAELFLSMSP